MTIKIWGALALANFVASLAPGQNMAYLAAAAVRAGPRGGLAALGGILVAELLWSVLALSLALSAREVSPTLFMRLQYASGGFLIWLGFCILKETAVRVGRQDDTGHFNLRCAARGVWVGLANPLALIFFLSLFPGFVSAGTDATDPAVIAFYVSAVLASSAAGLAPYLVTAGVVAQAGQARRLQMISGGSLVILGAVVLLRQLA
jgi:threonine/homoserine/homoserine lactone efflux protein